LETEENSEKHEKNKKEFSKINERIQLIKNEYNILKSNKINITKKTITNRTKHISSDLNNSKLAEEIKNRIANKSFSFVENESCN
jgi:hypothetical protein